MNHNTAGQATLTRPAPAAPAADGTSTAAAPQARDRDTRQDGPAMFAALAVPNFRRYVSGQALSLIGTWVETVAQALLVLRLTHSGTILGLTTAARYAPILLLSPYAGLLVDRYSKRRILLATQAGLGLVSAALGAAVLAGTSGCGRWSSSRCCSASSAPWTTRPGRRSSRRSSAAAWSATR